MQSLRRSFLCVCLALVAGAAWGGAVDEIRALVDADRLEEARQLIARTLDPDSGASVSDADRAAALRWLGRLEVADENWGAAWVAYERLTAELGDTDTALDAATELALLKALRASGGLAPDAAAPSRAEPTALAHAPAASAPEADTTPLPVEPAHETVATPSATGVLVGAFGVPFDSAEEAALEVQRYLDSNGIATEFEVTAAQALRGQDAVVAYLLTRVRELGRSTLILVRSRWGFREFIEVDCYTSAGALLWKERVAGGRYFREKEVTAQVMERLWPKLEGRIGGPGL